MKKILMYIAAVLALFMTACSSETEESFSVQNNDLIVQGKEFANIHNDCLAHIYKSLDSIKTRSFLNPAFRKAEIINVTNQYIAEHSVKTRNNVTAGVEYLTEETYDMTIEDIRNQMSEYELSYIDRFLTYKDSNKILEEVISDSNMAEPNKKAIICFVTTYEASSEYWQQNIDQWNDNIVERPVTRDIELNWEQIVLADAYWGYTGMLTSGLNVLVGGGAAAAGSAFACLK